MTTWRHVILCQLFVWFRMGLFVPQTAVTSPQIVFPSSKVCSDSQASVINGGGTFLQRLEETPTLSLTDLVYPSAHRVFPLRRWKEQSHTRLIKVWHHCAFVLYPVIISVLWGGTFSEEDSLSLSHKSSLSWCKCIPCSPTGQWDSLMGFNWVIKCTVVNSHFSNPPFNRMMYFKCNSTQCLRGAKWKKTNGCRWYVYGWMLWLSQRLWGSFDLSFRVRWDGFITAAAWAQDFSASVCRTALRFVVTESWMSPPEDVVSASVFLQFKKKEMELSCSEKDRHK